MGCIRNPNPQKPPQVWSTWRGLAKERMSFHGQHQFYPRLVARRRSPPAGRAMCKHLLAVGFHLHGPAWIRRFEDELFQLKDAHRQAWQVQLERANTFEFLALVAPGATTEDIENARAAVIQATEQAQAAQALYEAFYTKYIALFFSR